MDHVFEHILITFKHVHTQTTLRQYTPNPFYMFVLFYSYTFPEKKYPAKTDKIYRLHYFRYIFYLHFRYMVGLG